MAANPTGQGFQNKNRVAILADLDKEKRKLLMQSQSSTNHPGASLTLATKSVHLSSVSIGNPFPICRVLQPFCQTSDLPMLKNMDLCISLARSSLNKDFRDHAEQQHIAAQQKAALQHAHAHSSGYFITQDSAFGNLILPVLPRLELE